MKTLPRNLKVNVISQTNEGDKITFRLSLTNTDSNEFFTFDYTDGILAFLPQEKEVEPYKGYNTKAKKISREIRAKVNNRGRSWKAEESRQSGIASAHYHARINEMTVVNSLILGSQLGDKPFEEFCEELGYDSDSRTAEKMWKSCRDKRENLQRVLGAQFDEVAALVSDF